MAKYENKIELGNLVAKILIEQESKHYSSNGYDADRVHSNEPDKIFEVTVTATDTEALKKKITAVLEGGL